MNNIESKELQDYIRSSITAIKEGVEGTGFKIMKPIEFNLAVTNTLEGGGGLKIYVVKAEGKLKSEEISHIKFGYSLHEVKQLFLLQCQINFPKTRYIIDQTFPIPSL
jgi:hypothetical protein